MLNLVRITNITGDVIKIAFYCSYILHKYVEGVKYLNNVQESGHGNQ